MRFISLIFALFFSANAFALFQTDLLKGKKTTGTATQWTLADWLTQKNKQKLADQWLALHSSSTWFELNTSAASQQYKLKSSTGSLSSSTNQNAQVYRVDMYASIFNLNGEYEKTNDSKESYGGAAGLRFFGSSSRSTSLVARYGWRRLTDLKNQERWENQYLEGALQLYLVESFGLNGTYRYYFPATSNKGTGLQGNKVTAGAFFEVLIFRFYASYFQEPMQKTSAGVISKEQREGLEGGIKLLF